jgi:hypothetical protein
MFGFQSKTLLPAGAATPLVGGPVIASPRPECVPTFPPIALEWAKHAPPNKCIRPGCGGSLAVFQGIIYVDAGGVGGARRVEDSDRCRRKSYFGCSRCRLPVPLDHPMQVKLDADWRALEAKEKAEAERLAKAAAAASPPKPIAVQLAEAQAVEFRRQADLLAPKR